MVFTIKNLAFGLLIGALIVLIVMAIQKISNGEPEDKYDKYGNKLTVETEAEILASKPYDKTQPRTYLGPKGYQTYKRNYINIDLDAKNRLGTKDQPINWEDKSIKEFEFGGAGGLFLNDFRSNPLTEDVTCPTSYYKTYLQKPGGELRPNNHDFYCYKPIIGDYDPSESKVEFGGAYGERKFIGYDGDERDPLDTSDDAKALCPPGFDTLNVPGRGNWYNICYRKNTGQADWGTNTGRQKFGGFGICSKHSDDGVVLPCDVKCLDGYKQRLLSKESGYHLYVCDAE